MKKAFIDFETKSDLDIDVGVHKYATHPSTDIVCLGYQTEGMLAPKVWVPGEQIPKGLLDADVYLAFNMDFDYVIWNKILMLKYSAPYMHPAKAECLQVRASMLHMPMKLEKLAKALDLPVQKDTAGAKIMRRAAAGEYLTPEETKQLHYYCCVDVALLPLIDQLLPKYTHHERDGWTNTYAMNRTGLPIDTLMLKESIKQSNFIAHKLHKEADEKYGINLNSPKQVCSLLADLGVRTTSIAKDKVTALLEDETLNPTARHVLELRQAVGFSSTKKLERIQNCLSEGDRVRDNLKYYGAHTGRHAGRGIQIQNFPRGTLDTKELEHVISRLTMPVRTPSTLSLRDISSALRQHIATVRSHATLVWGDYASIEPRVLAHLSNNQDALDMYREGKVDPYIQLASRIYNEPYDTIGKGRKRDLGKMGILGGGYGLGPATLCAQAKQMFGLVISLPEAKKVTQAYRKEYKPVTQLWKDLETAWKLCLDLPDVRIKGWEYHTRKDWMSYRLPSGRKLYYSQPRLEKTGRNSWDSSKKELTYYGLNRNTRKPARLPVYGGLLTENLVQAISADILNFQVDLLTYKATGVTPIAVIHDEIVAVIHKNSPDALRDFKKYMELVPDWLPTDFPLEVEYTVAERYSK